MREYKFTIEEEVRLTVDVIVEANNPEEAKKKLEEGDHTDWDQKGRASLSLKIIGGPTDEGEIEDGIPY